MLRDGAAVVNISELARRTGYSRPTIYRALIFFTRFGKVRQIQAQRTGKRRPGIYTLNPAYLEEMRESATAEEKGVSAASVNLSYNALQEDQETNQPRPSTGSADSKTTSDKKRLTGWLAQADVKRPPTDQERRKLSVAIRLMICQDVANPLLDALWWRTKAPLRLWRDVIAAVWGGVSVPDIGETELTWCIRHGLKRLEQDGDRQAFLDALEQREQAGDTERRLQGLRQWRIAQGENCNGERLSWYVEIRRELERKLENEETRQNTKGNNETEYLSELVNGEY